MSHRFQTAAPAHARHKLRGAHPRERKPPASGQHERLQRACADLDAPFAAVDLDAFERNRDELVRRAAGKPIRLASKSLRCRTLMRRVIDSSEGFRGVLALTLPEALWLAETEHDDIVVAYPTLELRALEALASSSHRDRIAVMVDSTEHLDAIERAGADPAAPVRVCMEADAGLWLLGGRLKLGARRSPLHGLQDLAAFAAKVTDRPCVRLIGLMSYESQIAGVGDRPLGKPLRARAIQAMQNRSRMELAQRRAAQVAAVESVTGPLQLVNAGGTGSIESSVAEPHVTEVAAGSGLYGPALFDGYSRFTPFAAAFFALPVVRRPGPGVVTALGGGYVASGPAGGDRLPIPAYPPGLRLDRREGAGEAQTPLLGTAADRLGIGDRVWMRHAKAGELCERFEHLHLIAGDTIAETVPTYRGEGRCFL
jgi:D-serine deaminase-like pyridoxal phosphate-dependent protein